MTHAKTIEDYGMIHPCKCKDYNGGQCYNCLNGAHDICKAPRGCETKRAKQVGLVIKFKSGRLK